MNNSILEVTWPTFKQFVDSRSLSIQWVDEYDNYYLKALDGYFSLSCTLVKSINIDDVSDFETNYKANGNQSPDSIVTTQYELNNKDLKLAKIKSAVVPGTPNKAEVRLKIPGTFGNDNDGRWVAGGDGWIDTFDVDDYLTVDCYDDDRLIATAYGGLTDEQMQAQGTFPDYPLIKSYTDGELSEENRGWYFWPLAQGNNLSPMGEVEFEPIAGYGHIPAGFYLVITLIRPNQTTGTLRGNIFWGKKEP